MASIVTVDSSSGDILLSWIAHLAASLVILDTSSCGRSCNLGCLILWSLLLSLIVHLVVFLVILGASSCGLLLFWVPHLVVSLVIFDSSSCGISCYL